jgi:hypothetical protein
MHVSHRPLLPVWTPPAPAAKAASDSAEFVEIAHIAEDLGEGGKRGRFTRPRQGRDRQPRNEGAAADSGAKNSSDIAKWSPAAIAAFDLTTIGAANNDPNAASPEDAQRPQKPDSPEDELSLANLLARIVSAD